MSVFALIAACFSFDASNAQERFIYSSPLPQNEYGAVYARKFAEDFHVATNGAVEILVRQNGVLGLKGAETLGAVRDGLVHLADMQMNQQIGEESIFGIESMPCVARGFDDLRALQNLTRPLFEQAALRQNQKILFIYPMPRQNLFANTDVSEAPERLSGLRVRTIDRNGTDLFTELGAAPIQMPWAEVIPALSSGLLDGVSTSSTTAVSGAFWDFLDHATEMHWQMNSFMATVNLEAWNRIPARYRPIIEESAREIESQLWAAAREADETAKTFLADKGITFSPPGAALEQELAQACRAILTDQMPGLEPAASKILQQYLSASSSQ